MMSDDATVRAADATGVSVHRSGDRPSAYHVSQNEAAVGEDALFDAVMFQEGPIAEVGVNGVQVEHLLAICIDRLRRLNLGEHKNPYTEVAVRLASDALAALDARTAARVADGTEGTSAPSAPAGHAEGERELEREIRAKGLDAPRLTPALIDALAGASTCDYHVFHGKETVCSMKLPCGFTVSGRSACVSPENFDREIGERIARENAREQLWQLEGYRLQWKLHEQQMQITQHTGTSGMPLYRSHKVVRGARIVELLPLANEVDVVFPDGSEHRIQVPENLFAKCGDRPGYLVEYEPEQGERAGYLSWSPLEAFEGGYTRIHGEDAA